MEGDDFEWDEHKAAINLRRHRVSFETACDVFNDAFALVEQDASEDYGEETFSCDWDGRGSAYNGRLHRARRADSHHLRAKGQQQ